MACDADRLLADLNTFGLLFESLVVRDLHEERTGVPAVLGVITGSGYGSVRPDGVVVVPLGMLGV